MGDFVTNKKRSDIMSKIKSSDTNFEKSFRKLLWEKGYRYRKNVNNMRGKPDIYFPGKRIIIFLDSCFWHGCKEHCRMPKTNKSYWETKIEKNKKRDEETTKYYKDNNFKILRVWEHEIKSDPKNTIKKVVSFIERNS
jgi:DNA mismatch endonuclease (patch repair protein)